MLDFEKITQELGVNIPQVEFQPVKSINKDYLITLSKDNLTSEEWEHLENDWIKQLDNEITQASINEYNRVCQLCGNSHEDEVLKFWRGTNEDI